MKLVYFDCRGISETIRLILAYLDVEYTDYRYPLSVADLSNHQFVKPEFDKDKSDGLLLKSMNKVPYLQMDDGIVISQSKAIERYLARKHKKMIYCPECNGSKIVFFTPFLDYKFNNFIIQFIVDIYRAIFWHNKKPSVSVK